MKLGSTLVVGEIIEESGVEFNGENSFWGNVLPENCNLCGSEIPLTNYDEKDLEKIIEWSIEEIDDLGFEHLSLHLLVAGLVYLQY